jgi:hypothetical protein
MKTIRIIAVLLLLALAHSPGLAQGDERRTVRVEDFELMRDGSSVMVDFSLRIGEKAARAGSTLTIIPVLTDGRERVEMQPVTVRGRRAEILYRRRFVASPRTVETPGAIVAQNDSRVPYHATVPYAEWMHGAQLVLDGVDEGCCSAVHTNIGLVADELFVPREGGAAAPVTRVEKVVVPGTEVTTGEMLARHFPFVKEEGSDMGDWRRTGLTVHFRQGKSEIERNYRHNSQSLVDLLSVIAEIERSGDSQVSRIVIAGFASPEGTYMHNLRLSERRAQAVNRIVTANSSIWPERVELYGGGEDWEGLRALVEASDMWEKWSVLDIIDNVPVWDTWGGYDRETELKRLNSGETYRYMLRTLYPELREAAFITVFYKNR